MKILFIQLPLLDHGYNYILGNIPYAPACMSAFIRRHHGKKAQIDHLPFILAGFGSNGSIVKYAVSTGPDIICFTCYLWNVERSLTIAEEIKKHAPRSRIFMGGPEIQPGSVALSERRSFIEGLVSGEGEWFFDLLLSGGDFDRHRRTVGESEVLVQPGSELTETSRLVEPFTAGELDAMIDGSMFLEMTRGCPYRCSYCFYSKNCPRVRDLPFEVLLDAVGVDRGVSEIYILSPAFNVTENFTRKLRKIGSENKGVRLHTEMRAQGIDDVTAELLFRAGFRSCEVGLQTFTKEALRRVGRGGDGERELMGIKCLKNAELDVKIGVIPGLPGDTPRGFRRTLDRLVDEGLGDDIELYQLSMLPGTRIRDEADEETVVYQKRPPYYFTDGWKFRFEDVRALVKRAERATGYTQRISAMPSFTRSKHGALIRGLEIDGGDGEAWECGEFGDLVQTGVFTIAIKSDHGRGVVEKISRLFAQLPESDQLYDVVISSDILLDERRVVEFLIERERDSFQRRMNIFNEWKDGLSIRFTQVLEDLPAYWRAERGYQIIEPVFRVTSRNWTGVLARKRGLPRKLLVEYGLFPHLKDFLPSGHGDFTVLFESEDDQEAYYRVTGRIYVQWPFSLRMV